MRFFPTPPPPLLCLPQIKVWMQRINLKLTNKEMKDVFMQVDTEDTSVIDAAGFRKLYHILVADEQGIEKFKAFSSDKSTSNAQRKNVTVKDFSHFVQKEQKEKVGVEVWQRLSSTHLTALSCPTEMEGQRDQGAPEALRWARWLSRVLGTSCTRVLHACMSQCLWF